MKNAILLSLLGTFLFSLTTVSLANTCPTQLKQNNQGFWFSDEKPGWISHKATGKGVTVSSNNFGGVVFSPIRHRMACVYKDSSGSWIAFVSGMHKGFKIDESVKDDSGKGPAWKFSKKHKDYVCGNPDVTKINKCSFTIKE